MDTAQLHEVAEQWNWDDGVSELLQIIRDPSCALGTALLIYWRGCPHYYRQYLSLNDAPSYQQKTYSLLAEIEGRVTQQSYQVFGITFDPRNDRGTDWTKELYLGEPKRRTIPDGMFLATLPLEAIPFPPVQALQGKELESALQEANRQKQLRVRLRLQTQEDLRELFNPTPPTEQP